MISSNNPELLYAMYDRLLSEGKQPRIASVNGIQILCSTEQLNREIEARREEFDVVRELAKEMEIINQTKL